MSYGKLACGMAAAAFLLFDQGWASEIEQRPPAAGVQPAASATVLAQAQQSSKNDASGRQDGAGDEMSHDAIYALGDLEIHEPWAREGSKLAKSGAAFLSIVNTGAPDRLLSASSDVAGRVELHTHLMDKGIMKMRQVEAIDLPAGNEVHLQPGGFHVMLMGLKQQLVEGGSLMLGLRFERAGSIEIPVPIKKISYGGPKHSESGQGKHGQGKQGQGTHQKGMEMKQGG